MSRIIFVNHCYAPSTQATAQLLGDLAEGLVAQGRSVLVVTARSEPTAAPHETRTGVTVIRLVPAAPVAPAWARIGGWRRFHRATEAWLNQNLLPGDIVVTMSDPPLLAPAVSRACRRHGVRLIHWIQDIYPELLDAAGVGAIAQPLVALLRPARDRAWRGADACVTLGRTMAALVARRGVSPERIHISANWSPAATEAPSPESVAAIRYEWGVGDHLTAVYSGNLGRVHDLAPCLDVAAHVGPAAGVRFVFVGHGAQRRPLEEMATRRGLSHVSFHDPQPRARLPAALAAADVHWVTLRPGCEDLVYPSKLYGIAAAGRPVIAIAPCGSELAAEISTHKLGVCRDRGDTAALATQLQQWRDDPSTLRELAQNASRYDAANGGSLRALREWTQLLSQLEPMNALPRPV